LDRSAKLSDGDPIPVGSGIYPVRYEKEVMPPQPDNLTEQMDEGFVT
jgi:hypothetical protein